MPSYYNVTAATDMGIEDVDKFTRMPFYCVAGEQRMFVQLDDFTKLYGDLSWKPNMGDTMRVVTPEPSPIGDVLFYPNRINTDPNKSVFENLERIEDYVLRWHDYQSKMINFLPSWQDFRTNQLDFGHKDIVNQVANGQNTFVRTVMWDRSPNVYLAGAAIGSEVVAAPTATGNAAQTAANSKNLAWLTSPAILPQVTANLSWSVMKNFANVCLEDLQMTPFEGAKNTIAPNEMLKGRILIYASNDALIQLTDDADVIQRRSLQDDILFREFKGPFCNGMVTWKSQKFPIRFNDDGVFIAPQITEAPPSNKTRPNPAWVNAKYEVFWGLGAGAYRTVKVGPPPVDFTKLTKDKFWKMRWNSEVVLTDQFLITRGTLAGGDFRQELNYNGRFLKFMATQVMHGIVGGEVYNCLPGIFLRKRRRGQ